MRAFLTLPCLFLVARLVAQEWLWSQHVGGPGIDNAHIGAIDAQGAIYWFGDYARPWTSMTYSDCYFGTDTLLGSDDSFIAKTDANGALLWARSLNSPTSNVNLSAVVLDSAGSSLLFSRTISQPVIWTPCSVASPSAAVAISRWTLDGRCLWVRNIATSLAFESSRVYGITMAKLPGGSIFVSLSTDEYETTVVENESIPNGSFLVKLSASGELIWAKPFCSYQGNQKRVGISTLRLNGARIVGHGLAHIQQSGDTTTVDTISVIGRIGDGFILASLDTASGIAEWIRLDGYPGARGNPAQMDVAQDGSIHIACGYYQNAVVAYDTLQSPDNDLNGMLIKYTSDGSPAWVREFDGTGSFFFQGIDVLASGNLLVTGLLNEQIELGGNTFPHLSMVTSSLPRLIL
ncbi:MAG: hypothetical protein IPL52_07380 [Flavobacteriales bacterium]|nr:hypothetical protein [Flavobacteriales bacterium]